ncbi:hypothetical protein [Pseudaestuariivita rosea]|uniref:hypothetical protein n=1 Tax=Pseudaestuariivita rosea TaxID=2763263 RepID=UPI001ABBAC99|nr:hypothetical protein [Pseudaestuariivita rosea]
MELVLSNNIKSSLRFASNYQLHKKYLLDLDKTRFIGLGQKNTQTFVRHAMLVSDQLKFHYVEETQYIIFLMYFLGSYFYIDPRYTRIANILKKEPQGNDQRILDCHEVFSDFAKTYLGNDLSIYRQALEKFSDLMSTHAEQENRTQTCFEAFFKCYDLSSETQDEFPTFEMLDHAKSAAKVLGIETENGIAICLALSFWMGTGFYDDPLYPWVQDKANQIEDSSSQREIILLEYAQKRMKRQITALKGLNDV